MMSSASTASAPAETAHAMRGERPVDLVHLSRQTFGDKRLETELLRLFMRQARQIQGGLDAEVGDDAVSSLPAGDLLHTLVGSARVVGAHRVAKLAESYEVAPGAVPARRSSRSAIVPPCGRRVEEACGYIGGLLDAA